MVAFRASAVHPRRLEDPYVYRQHHKEESPWEKLRLFSLQGRKLDQLIHPAENHGHPQGKISRDMKVDTHSFLLESKPREVKRLRPRPTAVKTQAGTRIWGSGQVSSQKHNRSGEFGRSQPQARWQLRLSPNWPVNLRWPWLCPEIITLQPHLYVEPG